MPKHDASPSSLASWRRCRWQWWYKYRADLEQAKPSDALIKGSEAHRILELVARVGIEPGFRLGRNLAIRDSGFLGTQAADIVALDLPEIAGWHAVVEIEWEWWLERNGVVFHGRIDRVDLPDGGPMVRLWDYKSGAPTGHGEVKEWPSTWLYLAAAREQWPELEPFILFRYLRENRSVMVKGDEIREQEELVKGIKEVRMQRLYQERDSHEPTPGRHCRWCDFRKACPASQSGKWPEG